MLSNSILGVILTLENRSVCIWVRRAMIPDAEQRHPLKAEWGEPLRDNSGTAWGQLF
jgi:hypothetical protein